MLVLRIGVYSRFASSNRRVPKVQFVGVRLYLSADWTTVPLLQEGHVYLGPRVPADFLSCPRRVRPPPQRSAFRQTESSASESYRSCSFGSTSGRDRRGAGDGVLGWCHRALRAGRQPLFSHAPFPVYVAAPLWGGLALRDCQVRALVVPGSVPKR